MLVTFETHITCVVFSKKGNDAFFSSLNYKSGKYVINHVIVSLKNIEIIVVNNNRLLQPTDDGTIETTMSTI